VELPYEGEEGRTRRETVHVPRADGGTRTIEVLRSVNAHTDPKLRAAALEGTLHHTELGPLAVPYTFHDPEARRFVLVVPPELAHRLLAERSALLTRLAREERELPAYVASADAVVGAEGLAAYLAQDVTEDDGEERAAEEARLASERDSLEARERALGAETDRIQSLLRDLEFREQELEDRLSALQEREAAMLVESVELEGEPTSSTDGGEELVESVELVDDAYPAESTNETEGEFADEATLGEVRELPREATSVLDDDDVELLDEEDLPAELSDLQVDDGPSHAEKRIPTPATPPEGFFEDRSIQMMATMPDGPWLFVRLGEGHEEAFRDEVELLAQYLPIDDVPVVLLALVEWDEPRPYARRAALDPADEEDRAILEALRDGAKATAAVFGPVGRFERTLEVSMGARCTNLAAVLQRADRDRDEEPSGDPAVAMERALAAPPPLTLRGHPFHDAPPAENAKAAQDALQALAKWSKPAKLDMAILALSIPRDVVDDAFRRILDDAMTHGLAIRGPLVSRAVSLGVVPEPGEMVERLVDAFRGTARLEGTGGLDARAVAANWEGLLELAEEYEVAIDVEAHEQAHRDIAEARPGSQAPRAVDESAIPELSNEELVGLVEHPKLRRAVALELVSRVGPGDAELVARVVRAVRKMPRDEVLDVMPKVFPLGEAAAGALIDTLTARKTFVRQAAALCLGELQMRRAVRPLVQLLVEEPTEVWEEVARVLSSFGTSLERALRRVADIDGADRRIAYLLAHVRLNGGEELVEKIAAKNGDSLATFAGMAAEEEERARTHRSRVDGTTDLSEEDPIREFSRRFLAEVAS
jgi:hypothetical protein